MKPHPPIISLPQTLWQRTTAGAGWKESYETWAVNDLQRALALGKSASIQKDVLGLLPYRPDLLARVGAGALEHDELRTLLHAHPACALAVLMAAYEHTAEKLEPLLAGSGECIYYLLQWASERRQPLHHPENFYRSTLITDSYWGFLHAKRTGNASLLADLTTWCADERKNYSAAATFFLLHQPHEPVSPYRDVLLANPFYAYLALPRLSLRGFNIGPEDIATSPKWSCHFALSAFATSHEEFIARTSADPAWTVELAAGLGWLAQPAKSIQVGQTIAQCAAGHPLQRPAMRFLLDLKQAPAAA